MRGAETPNGWQWKRRHCYLAIASGCDFAFVQGWLLSVLIFFSFQIFSFFFLVYFSVCSRRFQSWQLISCLSSLRLSARLYRPWLGLHPSY